MIAEEPLLFELPRGKAGDFAGSGDKFDAADCGLPVESLRSGALPVPEISELDAVRHFTRLSLKNAGVDTHFYPLGSCTMKYNPRVNEDLAGSPAVTGVHPLWAVDNVQGALAVLWEAAHRLGEVSGFPGVSLQPAAGAQSELGSLMMIRRYHADRGRDPRTVLVPDTSHGTNPASASLCGLKVSQVPSGPDGLLDLDGLRRALSADTAAVMVTNPNTLGMFETRIAEAAGIAHAAGALVYLDGANMNAQVGVMRPADQGADIMHFNLHKTFATPHGGGGPGAGAIACIRDLEPYLPSPVVERTGTGGKFAYRLAYDRPKSIGRLGAFYGNFSVVVRALAYLMRTGSDGLADVARHAVLNANYVRVRLAGIIPPAYPGPSMHEVVLAGKALKERGISALDLAKRLLDHGFYAPTVYFPLIVPEAIMIEPTETESPGTLDAFVDAVSAITAEDPAVVKSAPHAMPVGRLDEVKAARDLVLKWSA